MEKYETATFAMGCFWGPQHFFDMQEGVEKTTVGYTGGEKENPTYEDLGDHTESVRIQFNPEKISYEKLLEHFWREHNPHYPTKTQYKSIIFYQDDRQKKLAEESLDQKKKDSLMPILTEIRPAGKFYPAEEYHQNFITKHNNPLVC